MLSWLDIRWDSALCLFQKIQQPIARRLQCNDPRSVANYISILESLLATADIVTMKIQLENTITFPFTPEDTETYEELDKTMTQCMLNAEKMYR